jgi:arginase
MRVRVIQVPSMAGDDRHPAAAGPQALLDAGALERLRASGAAASTVRADHPGPFADTATASLAVNREIARLVREAAASGELPLVLAGSCSASVGVLTGLGGGVGAVWIDAHADFNTPESSASGFFPGMSLAIATGHCYRLYRAQIGDTASLAEEAVLLLGVRELSPEEERRRLERSAIRVVPWRDGLPQGDVGAALDGLAERVREVYLHVDLDALDPAAAPGVVDEPVAGGLSEEQLVEAIREVGGRFRIGAATLATFTPARDVAGKTLRLALRILEVVATAARRPG